MTRAMMIEMRRSNAATLAITIGIVGAIWFASQLDLWLRQWSMFTYGDAASMFLLVPLALAGGATLGRRDRRTRADELMGSTGRPRWQRVTPSTAALAVAATAAHLLLVGLGAIAVGWFGSFIGVRGLLSVLVDVPVLVGATWVGIAAGRSWSSPLLPPALAAAALVVQLTGETIGGPGNRTALRSLSFMGQPPGADWESPNNAALLGRLGLGLGLALGGYLLTAGASWLTRAGGGAALAAGVAITMVVSPIGTSDRHQVDRAAQRLVCAEGTLEVCVTAVHAYLLPSVVPQARAALEKLRKLPGAPTRAVEWHADTVATGDDSDFLGHTPKTEPGTVFFRIDLENQAEDTDIEASILNGAGTTANGCKLGDLEALWAAGAWLEGGDTLPVKDYVFGHQLAGDDYKAVLTKLRQAPEQEQLRRVTAMRDAANACDTAGLTAILTGERAS